MSHEGARRAVGRRPAWAGVNVSGPNERTEEASEPPIQWMSRDRSG